MAIGSARLAGKKNSSAVFVETFGNQKLWAARLAPMIEAALSMAKVQFAHNRWANETLLEFLESMPVEKYSATPCSGNGPIGATVAHLILVQQSWISWLNGSMSFADAIAVARKTGQLDAAAAHAQWEEIDQLTTDYLDGLTDEAFVMERAFTLPSGVSGSLPLWEMLLQLTSHGVHTRGQIVSAIRSTGEKPPEVGFLRFCLTTKQQSIAPEAPEEDEPAN
jgi:uncharacterized damage-inducible protein DinB